jgi:integrase
MAAIRRRETKNGVTYSVQIRIRPYPTTNASFKKLTDAKRWAEKTEREMREGRYGMISESRKKTVSEAIERYRKYVLPKIIKSRREHVIDWWDNTIGRHALKEITPALITEIRDKLLHEEIDGKKRAPATVVKYLATLSHIFTMCVNEWQWLEINPIAKVSKPTVSNDRSRFLEDSERISLLKECQASMNPYLYTIVILAISTGMRRSEILNLTWADIDFERERIILRETKNGEVRILPLVGFCNELLKELGSSRKINSFLLFSGTDPKKPIDFRSAWRVAVKNAGLKNFKFHDLRHSFASYCVMNGSSLNEVADLLGHKSYQSVTKRYCHLSDAYRKDVVVSMNNKIFREQNG